jgi:purine-binding chemotaxis protein CheW
LKGNNQHATMTAEARDILIFEIAGQRFGLTVNKVRELLRATFVTRVPRQQGFVEGVINLRGDILSVLDIRRWLGLPAKALEPSDVFVIIEVGERLAVLRVDCVQEVTRVDLGDIGKVNCVLPRDNSAQMLKLPGGLVIIPDLCGLLSADELSLSAKAAAMPLVAAEGGNIA